MAEDIAIVTVHAAAEWCGQVDVMRLAWEKKLPSIKIGATRYVPTAFLRKLRENPERALREYAKATRYWILEPEWSTAELAAIAEIREEALAHALRRKPNRRPKWLASGGRRGIEASARA
jgi:hypothetical protein